MENSDIDSVDGRPLTAEGRLIRPEGEAQALTNAGVTNPQLHSNTSQEASGERSSIDQILGVDLELEVKVVSFSVLYDGDKEKFERLFALRERMHRVLNTAISEWHRADKHISKKSGKETFDRPLPAVLSLMERERSYWSRRLLDCEIQGTKIGRQLIQARAACSPNVADLEQVYTLAEKAIFRARIRSQLQMPCSIYDAAIRFTKQRYDLYKKAEFRGDRSLDTFRSDGPIRWRDKHWEIKPGEKRGHYSLELELHSDENGKSRRIERGVFDLIPNGGSMHAYAKCMTDLEAIKRGDVKLCDARLLYSKSKKQWFAKLTIKVPKKIASSFGTGVAALRRGVKNAFVLAFEDGDVRFIPGTEVLAFKRKLKARKVSLGKLGSSLAIGSAARGRGKTRRYKAWEKIDDAEARYVDWRCKTWAAEIAKTLVKRGVNVLLFPEIGKNKDMAEGSEYIEALLYSWPFAKMEDWIKRTCEKNGIEVKDYKPYWQARRCPNCKHTHEKRQINTFLCEVCGFERPVETIVAWNGLLDVVGPQPLEKNKKKKQAIRDLFTSPELSGV